VPNQRRRVLQVRHRSERERSSDGVPGARSAGDGGRALPAYDVHAVPCATSASCKFSRGLTRLGLSHLRGAAMCQLRDDAPTVARATMRPGVVRQPFSWRVRRYPVSLVAEAKEVPLPVFRVCNDVCLCASFALWSRVPPPRRH
jgi:hypothetical protein